MITVNYSDSGSCRGRRLPSADDGRCGRGTRGSRGDVRSDLMSCLGTLESHPRVARLGSDLLGPPSEDMGPPREPFVVPLALYGTNEKRVHCTQSEDHCLPKKNSWERL